MSKTSRTKGDAKGDHGGDYKPKNATRRKTKEGAGTETMGNAGKEGQNKFQNNFTAKKGPETITEKGPDEGAAAKIEEGEKEDQQRTRQARTTRKRTPTSGEQSTGKREHRSEDRSQRTRRGRENDLCERRGSGTII